MYRDRSPPSHSRLDSLLKRQTESLDPSLDSWKAFRSEVRAAEPTRKIEELKARNRQASPLGRSANGSFSHLTSPRERLGGQFLPGHISSQSTDRRYQSPITKARDKFEAFYEGLKTQGSQVSEKRPALDRIQALAKGPLPPRSPTGFDFKLQGLSALPRTGSPYRKVEGLGKDARGIHTILPLERLQQARESLQRSGLQGASATYESELRAFAKLILASSEAPS